MKRCQRKNHDSSEQVRCNSMAAYGPGFERKFCGNCVERLKLRDTCKRNHFRCIRCGDGTEKHRVRYGRIGWPCTHCKTCGVKEGLGNAYHKGKMCQGENDDGSACSTIATVIVQDQGIEKKMCTKHGADFEDRVMKVSVCKISGCGKNGWFAGFCYAHANEREIKTEYRMCKDCDVIVGSFKCRDGHRCRTCLNARLREDPNFEFVDLTAKYMIKCVECKGYRAQFARIGEAPTRCGQCKLPGITNVYSYTCESDGCHKTATFGFKAEDGSSKRVFCGCHRVDGMVYMPQKVCSSCKDSWMNPEYESECARCYYTSHPDEEPSKNFKLRENAFMEPLKTLHPEMTRDKTIRGGLSMRRPDGFIDCGGHAVVVEIDEDQHASYDPDDQLKRLEDLREDVRYRSLVIVRLNPDGYKRDNKRHLGVFKSKKSKLVRDDEEYKHRFKALVDSVENAISSTPVDHVTVSTWSSTLTSSDECVGFMKVSQWRRIFERLGGIY